MDDREVYFELWKIEHSHVKTRWTITTFFVSASFTIFGLSFSSTLVNTLALANAVRGTAVLLYIVGYLLFFQFYKYTEFLRGQLRDWESKETVQLNFQKAAEDFFRKQGKGAMQSTGRILLVLLIFYIIAFTVLSFGILQ